MTSWVVMTQGAKLEATVRAICAEYDYRNQPGNLVMTTFRDREENNALIEQISLSARRSGISSARRMKALACHEAELRALLRLMRNFDWGRQFRHGAPLQWVPEGGLRDWQYYTRK